MLQVIESGSADALWRQSYELIEKSSYTQKNSVRGQTSEIHHVVMTITDPRQRWVTSRIPAINPVFAIAEVVWILRGRSDLEFLAHWNKSLTNFVGPGPQLEGAYGERLLSNYGVDQLRRVAKTLAVNGQSRQAVLQIWDPRRDIPRDDGSPQAADVPCNIMGLLKIVRGNLEWFQTMRSNDLILGLPYNIIQWTTIQEIMAGWIGVDVGHYHHLSDSLHVYDRDLGRYGIRKVQPVEVEQDLRLCAVESDLVFLLLERVLPLISLGSVEHGDVLRLCRKLPSAYQNWLWLALAEASRRRGDPDGCSRSLGEVSCKALVQIFALWMQGIRDRKG